MKKRKDSYFGLHFDMHANCYSKNIGSQFDDDLVDEICREVAPDFIQVDSKGHPGYSSYPTKYGVPAPDISRDILRAWRRGTEKYGIALYAHHSGVFDMKQAELHPEWAVVDENGEISKNYMSFFSDYADKVLIPQLKEIALDYKLNGAWVDGECWAVVADYSDGAQKAFGKPIPKPNEDGYREFQDFIRKSFISHVKHYISEVKSAAPDFEITSNWMNSTEMPEEINITDFISGDLSPTDCINFSRYSSRVIASHRRPWDIMSWGFSYPVHYVKSKEQLMQEAASVIMLGGGFQVYNMQDPNKVLQNSWIVPTLKSVAEFCREREWFCHKGTALPDVGLVYSIEAYYHKREEIYSPNDHYTAGMRGMMSVLLDNQVSCDVLMPSRIAEKDSYSVLVLSNCEALEANLKNELLQYANSGGTLFICGADAALLFKDELKIRSAESGDLAIVRGGDMRVLMSQKHLRVKTDANVRCVMNPVKLEGDLSISNPPPKKHIMDDTPSLIEVSYGKGRIIAVLFNLGEAYELERSAQLRRLVGDVLSEADLKLRVDGTHYVDTALMQNNGKHYVHLLNTAGEHRAESVKTFDEIPPVYNISVSYKIDEKPKSVRLLPAGIPLDFEYENGCLKCKVEKVDIHAAIEIE